MSALRVARKREEASVVSTLLLKAGAWNFLHGQTAYGPPETALEPLLGHEGIGEGTTGMWEEAIKTREWGPA